MSTGWVATPQVLEEMGDLLCELAEPGDEPALTEELCYCQAVSHYRAHPDRPAWYSTEDEFMLKYRKTIQERMGLEIVTRDEAAQRVAKTFIAHPGSIAEA